LFIVEQGSLIKILDNGIVQSTPFLDFTNSVDTAGERGLPGLAFDPGFETNRCFYVNYIDKSTHNTFVATYQADAFQPSRANNASAQTVLTISQPEGSVFHKGGWIGFRPNEPANLYIAAGDGGPGNNAHLRAQNLTENLGKILRIDVSAGHFPGDVTRYGYTIPSGKYDRWQH
jgi:glucose/arabinose dehydrogenase